MIRILPVILIILSGCNPKSDEYWLQPENQNGSLDGFHATEEYCNSAREHGSDYEIILALNDSLETLMSDKAQFSDSVLPMTVNILDSIEDLYNIMLDHCGGRCITDGSFPVLPYRTVDVYNFWSHIYFKSKLERSIGQFQKLSNRDSSNYSTGKIFYR